MAAENVNLKISYVVIYVHECISYHWLLTIQYPAQLKPALASNLRKLVQRLADWATLPPLFIDFEIDHFSKGEYANGLLKAKFLYPSQILKNKEWNIA